MGVITYRCTNLSSIMLVKWVPGVIVNPFDSAPVNHETIRHVALLTQKLKSKLVDLEPGRSPDYREMFMLKSVS